MTVRQTVCALALTLLAGSAYVLGEVGKPGRVELDRPRTVLMTLAQAGGVTTAGAMNAVRLLYVGDDGVPRIRSINLNPHSPDETAILNALDAIFR